MILLKSPFSANDSHRSPAALLRKVELRGQMPPNILNAYMG